MRKGFTLVELAIVLVMVGLLIGGILVAQSMVSTSRINGTAAQIQQYDAGVMAFKSKYNYLPGDAPAYGGDGDGYIEGMSPNFLSVNAWEITSFWYGLNNSEFIATVSAGGGGGGAAMIINGNSKTSPPARIADNTGFLASTTGTGQFTVAGAPNYYLILKTSQIVFDGFWWRYRNIPPHTTSASNLLALDKKIDDGIANTGYVISGDIQHIWPLGNGYFQGVPSTTADPNCSSGGTYIVSTTTDECTPAIRIGGQVNDPQ